MAFGLDLLAFALSDCFLRLPKTLSPKVHRKNDLPKYFKVHPCTCLVTSPAPTPEVREKERERERERERGRK